jgi:hypothetical protein
MFAGLPALSGGAAFGSQARPLRPAEELIRLCQFTGDAQLAGSAGLAKACQRPECKIATETGIEKFPE